MPDEPIEECWNEIRPPRDPVPEPVQETQVITFDTDTSSGLNKHNKEELCERIAKKLIGKNPDWTLFEDQATNFMTMTDEAVLETARRIGIQLVVAPPHPPSRVQELINELNEKIHY
jgi:hypothetical protein